MIMATRPQVGSPISWAKCSVISPIFSDSVLAGTIVVETSFVSSTVSSKDNKNNICINRKMNISKVTIFFNWLYASSHYKYSIHLIPSCTSFIYSPPNPRPFSSHLILST